MRNSPIPSKERLEHIMSAIESIEEFVSDKTKEDFLNDKILQNALLYQFAVIGEAVIHIDIHILEKYPYPWHNIRSFRNFIVHEYHAIEIWIVWETVENNIPELKSLVRKILANEF